MKMKMFEILIKATVRRTIMCSAHTLNQAEESAMAEFDPSCEISGGNYSQEIISSKEVVE